MKKKKLSLNQLRVKSFTTSEEKSIKAGRIGLPKDNIPIDDYDTMNGDGCNSAIAFHCQVTNNNEVGCV